MKIRLHMLEVKANYKRPNMDTKCPMCKDEEDT